MELFETSKMNLATCFYYPNQTRIIDAKRLLVILVGILVIISTLLFILFESGNATGYVISAFTIVVMFSTLISFIDTAAKTTQIFALIDISVKSIKRGKNIDIFMFVNCRKLPDVPPTNL